jgi:hypothetical protein
MQGGFFTEEPRGNQREHCRQHRFLFHLKSPSRVPRPAVYFPACTTSGILLRKTAAAGVIILHE